MFIKLMHSSSSEEMLVRTRKDKVVLHPGKLTAVRCCAHTHRLNKTL